MDRRDFCKATLYGGAAIVSAVLAGCSFGPLRDRTEGHYREPRIDGLVNPYNASGALPILKGPAVAMFAHDYAEFAEKYKISQDIYTIRAGTRLAIRVKDHPEYDQIVHAMRDIDLLSIGTVAVAGRPLTSVRTEIETKYAALTGVETSDITVNLDKPVEGESVTYAKVTVFDATRGRFVRLYGPMNLDQALAAAELPNNTHEWNEVLVTRRLRDEEYCPTSIIIDTKKGRKTVNTAVLVADLGKAINGQGDIEDNISVMEGDCIYLMREQRDALTLGTQVLGVLRGASSDAATIDDRLLYLNGEKRALITK